MILVGVGGAVVAGEVAVLTSAGGGGGGESGVAKGGPAEPDELPVANYDECGVVDVLVVEVGPTVGGVALAPGAAFGAEPAEGDGVPTGLGGEVAAEAEHVQPAGQL